MIVTASPESQQAAAYDALLVDRFKTGDEPAFTEIVNRHWERAFGIAFVVLKMAPDAEEVAQDTFVRAHRSLPKFRGDSSLATWLHCIARRLAINRYMYHKRRKISRHQSIDAELGDDGSDASLHDLLADGAPSTVSRVEFAELHAALLRTINNDLSDEHRRVMRLRWVSELDYEAIARILGIPVGTVKSKLARARFNTRYHAVPKLDEFV